MSCSGGSSSQPSRIISPTFIKEFRYDARGRKFEERNLLEGETQTTSFTYDKAGNLTNQTDPAGHSISDNYDALNRLQSVTDLSASA
ncbi:MAG: RHS repeat protein [bacterium]|nr:RHS repeat protein [bacterium]